MSYPPPVYLKPGSDPSTQEYQAPGCTLTGCLIIVLLLVGAGWAFYVVANLSSKPANAAPTMAHSWTPEPTLTASSTATAMITYTPSNTPTGTLPPTETPTATATDSLATRIYGRLVTATTFPSLTATSTATAIPPTNTPRPLPTRRPAAGRTGGSSGSNPPPNPTQPPQPPQPQPPIFIPGATAVIIPATLPPDWMPTPIWDGTLPPTVDYSPTIEAIPPTLEATATATATEAVSYPTLQPTFTPSPTYTPTVTPTQELLP